VIFDQRKFEQYLPAKGFSLVFWIYFNKPPKSKLRVRVIEEKSTTSSVVLFIKNRFTAELTVGVKDKLLFYELKYTSLNFDSSPKKEKTYSEKELMTKAWNQVVLTCRPENELSELILYVNGRQESTVSIKLSIDHVQ